MRFKKSVRQSITGLVVAAQLFSSFGPVIAAQEINNDQSTKDERVPYNHSFDAERISSVKAIWKMEEPAWLEQKKNFVDYFSKEFSQIDSDSVIRPDVLFAVATLHTVWGSEEYVLRNDYFPSSNQEEVSTSFEVSLTNFLQDLQNSVYGDLFTTEQSLDEQLILMDEYLQTEGLTELLLDLTLFYNELSTSEDEEEVTPPVEESAEVTEPIEEETVEEPTEEEEVPTEVEEEKEEAVEQEQPRMQTFSTFSKAAYDTITSEKAVEYMAEFTNGNFTIDTLPAGVQGATNVSNSKNYLGQTHKILAEAVTQKGTFVKFRTGGRNLWVNKAAVTPEAMTNTKDTNYRAMITRGTDTLNSLPWGVPGFKSLGSTAPYLGMEVRVLKETTTPRANWVYVELTKDGTDLGWMDMNGISKRGEEPILSSERVNYQAKIVGVHSLDTAPWGTKGFKTVDSSSKYIGTTVYVLEEAVTYRAHWAKIRLHGKELWIDIAGLEPETMTNQRSIKYDATIIRGTDTINSLPWGVKGFVTVGRTSDYLNQKVTVIEEATTPRANWVRIQYNGQVLGWIDQAAIKLVPNYTAPVDSWISSTSVNYQAKIVGKHSLDTLPWGIEGFKTVGRSENHIGTTVRIVEEAVTSRAKWVKFSLNGQFVWMDIKGIEPETILFSEKVDYEATVNRGTDTINSLPWGVKGYRTVGKTSNYLGQKVRVIEVATTPRATWALISLNGKTLGWVDIEGLKNQTHTVFIDVGHGGNDPGAVYYGVNEKDINLRVSLKLQKELENRGYEVIMLRTTDVAVDFKTERSRIANATNADIFISVHHNANPWVPTAHGIETFYYQYDPNYPSKINHDFHNDPVRVAESARLATNIHNALIRETGLYDRGVKRDTFAVLRETRIPAVLLELGFMSNRQELNLVSTDAHMNKEAKAVADGIDNYFNK